MNQYYYLSTSIGQPMNEAINDKVIIHLPSKEFLDVLLLKDYKIDQSEATQLEAQESYSSSYLKSAICYEQIYSIEDVYTDNYFPPFFVC